MTIHLDLPPELERELFDRATRLDLSLSEYIIHLLSLEKTFNNPPKTGAELVAYWQTIGAIGSRSDINDSQIHARQLRHEAENR